MSRPATVEKQLREAFEALKEEGNKAPTLKQVSDKAAKKKIDWGKYETLRSEIQAYAEAHKKSEEKKATKKKSSSKNLKKENEILKEENSRLLSLLERYVNKVNNLQQEQELKGQGVRKLG
jgi:chromosome segregation ATPase